MKYVYNNRDYYLELNREGKIFNPELDIEGDTAEEVKAAIRKHVDSERDPKKRIKVLTFGEAWRTRGKDFGTVYFEGQTTANADLHNQVWVTWKQGGDTKRAKMNTKEFCLDTPENRARMDQITEIEREIERLEEAKKELTESLERLKITK